MKRPDFGANITARLSNLVRRLAPSEVGGGFVFAAALTFTGLGILTLDRGSLSLALAWALWLAAAVLLFALHRRIRTRLDKISEGLESIELGELSGRVDNILGGESGRVIDSVRRMNAGLITMVDQVRGSSQRISVAAREIAAGSSELSQRTEEQATSLEQTAASMEELTSTVKQSSHNAREANELARHASDVAARGGEIVSRVVATMNEIRGSSKQIAEIITVIDTIAFQTNILALNAAVEAARAGEQGRGFAVVAAEVRSLAHRSAESAKEIKRLIHQSVDRVENGSSLASQAGITMSEIVAAVKDVSELMAGIATASAQQSSGIHEINQTVAVMEQVTQQNAALVEQTHAAAQLFENEVDKLQEAVGHFKLERAEGRHTAVALVRQGVEHLQRVGKRRACDDFDDPKGEFIFGEYYISAFDIHGVRMANGLDPASRGENIFELRDADGKQHVRAIIEKAKARGKGWEDYKWTNPVTRRVEPKSVYFELIDNIIVSCGIYKTNEAVAAAPSPAPAQAAPLRLAGGPTA